MVALVIAILEPGAGPGNKIAIAIAITWGAITVNSAANAAEEYGRCIELDVPYETMMGHQPHQTHYLCFDFQRKLEFARLKRVKQAISMSQARLKFENAKY